MAKVDLSMEITFGEYYVCIHPLRVGVYKYQENLTHKGSGMVDVYSGPGSIRPFPGM